MNSVVYVQCGFIYTRIGSFYKLVEPCMCNCVFKIPSSDVDFTLLVKQKLSDIFKKYD